MEERERVLKRLRELAQQHEASIGEGGGEAPGFAEDEQITRKSYKLMVEGALDAGVLTGEDLQQQGLPKRLEEAGYMVES